jgi:hypothetical protein
MAGQKDGLVVWLEPARRNWFFNLWRFSNCSDATC